jgi:hypothetical protein
MPGKEIEWARLEESLGKEEDKKVGSTGWSNSLSSYINILKGEESLGKEEDKKVGSTGWSNSLSSYINILKGEESLGKEEDKKVGSTGWSNSLSSYINILKGEESLGKEEDKKVGSTGFEPVSKASKAFMLSWLYHEPATLFLSLPSFKPSQRHQPLYIQKTTHVLWCLSCPMN